MRRLGPGWFCAVVQGWPSMSANPTTTWCSTIRRSDSTPARLSTSRQSPSTGVAPVAVTSTANANLSGTVISRPLHESDSYLEQFNLVLQKEFGGTVLTAGYVAELGRHIQDQIPNLDLPAPTGPVAAGTAPPPLVYLWPSYRR